MLTVRGTAFAAAEAGGSASTSDISSEASDLSSFVGQELTKSDRPELASAPKVLFRFRSIL